LARKLIQEYEVDREELGLNEVEFGYVVAELLGHYPVDKKCQNCLQKTRSNIADFYDFIDCDKDK